jgi:hypothetical protein
MKALKSQIISIDSLFRKENLLSCIIISAAILTWALKGKESWLFCRIQVLEHIQTQWQFEDLQFLCRKYVLPLDKYLHMPE